MNADTETAWDISHTSVYCGLYWTIINPYVITVMSHERHGTWCDFTVMTWLFVQLHVQVNNKKHIKALHYWTFVRGILVASRFSWHRPSDVENISIPDPLIRGPFHQGFFACNSNLMETSPYGSSITGHQITTKFCTCHNSTAVVACAITLLEWRWERNELSNKI